MIENIQFDERGLVTAVVQDANTKEVLTVAYMNKESLAKTIESGETWFYSRSRQELWHKGATSGHTQKVISIKADCDQDALVVEVLPAGPACHNGTTSCFTEVIQQNAKVGSVDIIAKLVDVIKKREQEMPEGAYTTYLFDKGIDKICKKVGEEATEVVIGAKNRDAEEVKWEVADLIYHLLVLLQEQKVSIYDVLHVLEKRHEEK
ncbi:bifunctional phosphoribosyl-AMP cyclohydrolase/phosphoribosyl-ATP diphosphatase HisIE [Lysinibacillus cavernae]|uniref:bifunctional phosphoribosyl-AMP cyclohydrolase/phosphoribosyl-ATP diphosphatase HisIE n=1 Tax=Lysinibacillus cavernae TaxID=2666135 RepID=UPI0012D9F44D|nr:bifunctional phosphoribosyl-AMP cyclohydrolase/phosphoribosyl-ATP diphosphatase HisIE [Lysinibacillus cavernae]